MPRGARVVPGGIIFHVLNRANARSQIFETPQDYQALERVLAETARKIPVRILAKGLDGAQCSLARHSASKATVQSGRLVA